MNTPASKLRFRPEKCAFTLTELIVVIGIIAILMLLLFPAIQAIQHSMRKTEAKTALASIVAGLKQYYTEYGKYPTVVTATPLAPNQDLVVGDTSLGALADNADIFNTLRALDIAPNTNHILNPRKIPFFEHKNASNPAIPKNGFVSGAPGGKSVTGALYDPWGTQYFIILDSNFDNHIDLTGFHKDFSGVGPGGSAPQVGVGAFSVGRDNAVGDGRTSNRVYRVSPTETTDDVVSWQ